MHGYHGDVAPRTSRRRLRLAVILVVVALGLPCLVSSLAAGWDLPAVVATGVCDIPAYPCSPQEFLLRMTVGPWALAGHILHWWSWAALVGPALLLVAILLRAKGAAGSPATPGRVVYDSTRRIE